MSLLAGDLIEAARDRHASFDRERTPDLVLLRFLSREQRRLMGKLAQANPQAVSVTQDLLLSAYDWRAGFLLLAYQALDVRGEVIFTDPARHAAPLHIRALADQSVAGVGYFAGAQGDVLRLFGVAADWEGVERVRVRLAPLPDELKRLGDPLTVPDTAEAALVASLTAFLAGRAEGVDGRPFYAEAVQYETDLIREIRSSYRAVSFKVREVC